MTTETSESDPMHTGGAPNIPQMATESQDNIEPEHDKTPFVTSWSDWKRGKGIGRRDPTEDSPVKAQRGHHRFNDGRQLSSSDNAAS